MNAGEPFDPTLEGCGFYPADVIEMKTRLSTGKVSGGCKLIYRRFIRYASEYGYRNVFPFKKHLSLETGRSIRQVARYIAETERHCLIRHRRLSSIRALSHRVLTRGADRRFRNCCRVPTASPPMGPLYRLHRRGKCGRFKPRVTRPQAGASETGGRMSTPGTY